MKLWAFLKEKEYRYGFDDFWLRNLDAFSPEIHPDAHCHTRVIVNGDMIDRIEGYVLTGGHLWKTVSQRGDQLGESKVRFGYTVDRYDVAEVVTLRIEHNAIRDSFYFPTWDVTLYLTIQGLTEPLVLSPPPNREDAEEYQKFCQALITLLS